MQEQDSQDRTVKMANLCWRAITIEVGRAAFPGNREQRKGRGWVQVWDDQSPEQVQALVAAAQSTLAGTADWDNSPDRTRTRTALKKFIGEYDGAEATS